MLYKYIGLLGSGTGKISAMLCILIAHSYIKELLSGYLSELWLDLPYFIIKAF